MGEKAQCIWRYRDIDVLYEPGLDGGGSALAPRFVHFIRQYFGAQKRFTHIFEWCAGPGFIGFALLAEGLCDSLSLADINPAAIACAQQTIKENRLEGHVHAYLSDNLKSVPKHEPFDLAVGNPPNFSSINPAHPFYNVWGVSRSLITLDPDWHIHGGFYSAIADYLSPGAHVLVQEVEPDSCEIFCLVDSPAFEIRPEVPGKVFAQMMRGGGLAHVENRLLDKWPDEGAKFSSWLQIARKPSV